MPEYSLVAKGEDGAGGKLSKERLTLLVCTNASGTKKSPLTVIGKSKNPRGMPQKLPVEQGEQESMDDFHSLRGICCES